MITKEEFENIRLELADKMECLWEDELIGTVDAVRFISILETLANYVEK